MQIEMMMVIATFHNFANAPDNRVESTAVRLYAGI